MTKRRNIDNSKEILRDSPNLTLIQSCFFLLDVDKIKCEENVSLNMDSYGNN